MNFALILFGLVVITGIAWVADKLVFEKQRRLSAHSALAEFDARRTDLVAQRLRAMDEDDGAARDDAR